MQADWEFEVGGDAPSIDAYWEGFVDLRAAPERVHDFPETANCAGLAGALLKLNSSGSPVWTAKCDFWPALDSGDYDADELDAPEAASAHAMACYIDILPGADGAWSLPQLAETASRQLCELLDAVPLRCCRVDLVVRRALLSPERTSLGITAYITGCGATVAEAARTLEIALDAFANAVCDLSTLQ